MRVLVCGSRDWRDKSAILIAMATVMDEHEHEGVTFVHGGARGADQMCGEVVASWGELGGANVEVYPADWQKHGKAAGFIRNEQMLDTGIDLVLAFQRNGSRGTEHTIRRARERGVRMVVYVDHSSPDPIREADQNPNRPPQP